MKAVNRVAGCMLALFAAQGFAGPLAIEAPYLFQPPPGQVNAAVYMELHNAGNEPLFIVAAHVDGADSASIHGHVHRDGMMSMAAVPRLEVPPGARVGLRSGGYHLMVTGLKSAPVPGATLPFCLRLDDGAEQCAQAQIRKLGE